MAKATIKKGDTVKILAGKDRGKTGKVLKMSQKSDRVLVEGINLFKKHKRPTRQDQKGETVTLPRTIHRSNVMHIDKVTKRQARKK